MYFIDSPNTNTSFKLYPFLFSMLMKYYVVYKNQLYFAVSTNYYITVMETFVRLHDL